MNGAIKKKEIKDGILTILSEVMTCETKLIYEKYDIKKGEYTILEFDEEGEIISGGNFPLEEDPPELEDLLKEAEEPDSL